MRNDNDLGALDCYLPVALMCRGVITVVAGEVALTPFHAAERTVCESELE